VSSTLPNNNDPERRVKHTVQRLAIVAAMMTASAASAQSGLVVRTTNGPVRGASEADVVSFKGIPFAAPPVGPLRWRAPQPPAPWNAVRDATRYAADCMQLPFPSDAAPLGTAPAEDCLYANIWRPAGAAKKLPVMVWIYGGGFVNGGSSPPTYSGAALARAGIMVLSFNYRLGRFGSFAHPKLTPADADYGLLDQLAALRWVKANVARFGGDPDNVTIIGESAGGMSVHALLTSPAATGLFRRAVVQSGGTASSNGTSLATAEAAGIAFAASNGIAADDPQAAAKLRALPAEQVIGGLNLAAMNRGGYSGPVPDGTTFVDSLPAYRAGHFAHVPMMIGATSADIGGPTGQMITGARDLAGLLAAQQVPVYYYRFDYVATSAQTPETKGASHATDIPFFFDTADVKYGAATSDTDRAAARAISGYLVNFVKTGNPNGGGAPAWQPYSAATHTMLTLTRAGSAQVAPE
jgi:para-nitrobenzyl esterase